MTDNGSYARHLRTSSTLNGDHHDFDYNETLSQIYDTALATIDHSSNKNQHKSSLFQRTNKEPQVFELDTTTIDNEEARTEHRKRSDSSSTSTASSDGTPHDFEMCTSQKQDEPTLYLASALKKGPSLSVKEVVAGRIQQGWHYLFGNNKPIEVFLEAARYPSEVREPC